MKYKIIKINKKTDGFMSYMPMELPKRFYLETEKRYLENLKKRGENERIHKRFKG